MAMSSTSSRIVFKLEKYSFSRSSKASALPNGVPGTTTGHERSTSGGLSGIQEWTHFTQPHLTAIWEESWSGMPTGPAGGGSKSRKLNEPAKRVRLYVVWTANEPGAGDDDLETQMTQQGSQQASPREATLENLDLSRLSTLALLLNKQRPETSQDQGCARALVKDNLVNVRYTDLDRWPDAAQGSTKLSLPPSDSVSRFQIKFAKVDDANAFVKLLERMMPIKWHDPRQESRVKAPLTGVNEIVQTQDTLTPQADFSQTQVQTQNPRQEFATPFLFRAATPARAAGTPESQAASHVFFPQPSQLVGNANEPRPMGPPIAPYSAPHASAPAANPVPQSQISLQRTSLGVGQDLGSPFQAQTPAGVASTGQWEVSDPVRRPASASERSTDIAIATPGKQVNMSRLDRESQLLHYRQHGLITPPGQVCLPEQGMLTTQDAMMTPSSRFAPGPTVERQTALDTAAEHEPSQNLANQPRRLAGSMTMGHEHWRRPQDVSISRRLLELEDDNQTELVRQVIAEDGFLDLVEHIQAKGLFADLSAFSQAFSR